jgi:hypothetical protein
MSIEQFTQLERRRQSLRNDRSSYLEHWRDLSDYVSPRTSRFLATDRLKQGYTRNPKILDNTATIALRTLGAGMMSGITSPARPWFQLRTPDPSVNSQTAAKNWLDQVRKLMMEAFLKSNLYTTLPSVYSDLGLYSTSAFAVLEDTNDVLRCVHFPIGSYSLGGSERGNVNACVREFQMTTGQLVEKFGKENCSPHVVNLYDLGSKDTWIDVVHSVESNLEWDDSKLESKYKQFRSIYYELGTRDGKMLSDKGFEEFPVIAPRWLTVGEDVYGVGPGMDALSDIKMLQSEQKRKLQAIDKMVTPPMVGPESMKNKRASLLSGDITYVDVQTGHQSFTPAYQVNLNLSYLAEDIREVQKRVNDAFYKDLFLMIANDERSGVTATEIAARQEEKLLALGPVYLKLNDEMLDPLIHRTFGIMLRAGLFPTPPQEIQGKPISVEYISVMAQTMKAVGVAGIERVMTFAGNMGQAFPGVLDKLDADVAIEEYADMMGTPPKLVKDDKTVAAIRSKRAANERAQQQMAMAQQGADAANKLGNTPMGDNNALSQLMQRMQGGPPAPMPTQGAA